MCTQTHGETPSQGPFGRLFASFGAFWSTLRFGDEEVPIDEQAVLVGAEIRPSPRLSLVLSSGAIVGGTLSTHRRGYTIGPGWVASAGAAYRLVDQGKLAPFVLLSGTFSGSSAQTSYDGPPGDPTGPSTERLMMRAIDARVGVAVGKTFFDTLSPYLAARAFGGPIWWKGARGGDLGTDKYKYQLGAGLSVLAPAGVDVFGEIMPVGERRVSAGLGVSFLSQRGAPFHPRW